MCAHAKRLHLHNKDPEAHIRVWWTVNHQSNSARTKTASLRVFQVLDVGAGHNREEEKEDRTVTAMQSLLTASDTGGSAVLAALPLATGVCRKSGLMSGTSTGKRGSMKVVARMMWSMKNG